MLTSSEEPSKLEIEVDRALGILHEKDVMSKEYATLVEQIVKLHKMKEDEKPSRVSPNTWAIVGANLLGIVLIISYEYSHVITSKALGRVLSPR